MEVSKSIKDKMKRLESLLPDTMKKKMVVQDEHHGTVSYNWFSEQVSVDPPFRLTVWISDDPITLVTWSRGLYIRSVGDISLKIDLDEPLSDLFNVLISMVNGERG